MNTHLIITIVFLFSSLFIGTKVPRDTHLSFIFLPVFVIVAAIGTCLSYLYSFPSFYWEGFLTEWGALLFLGILFSAVLGLPFMFNHSEVAWKFIGVTLLLSFALGLCIFSGTFFALLTTIVGFLIGLLLRSNRKSTNK